MSGPRKWQVDHRRPRKAVIGFRVTPAKRTALDAKAANQGLRISDLVRVSLGLAPNLGNEPRREAA